MSARTALLSLAIVITAAACTYTVGELAREAPSGEPDGGSASSCDTLHDGENCGTCGHDCLGEACDDGLCRPKLVADAQDDLTSIAVDDRSLYWGGGGGLWYCPTKDCAKVERLADEEQAVVAIAPTSTHLFWTLGHAVKRWTRGTGEIVAVDDGVASSAVALAANETSFYWTVSGDVGGVARCNTSGCIDNRSEYVAGYGWKRPIGLALGAEGFLFASGDGSQQILYCAPTCGAPGSGDAAVLAEGQSGVTAVVTDDRYAFWTSSDALMRASIRQPFVPAPIATIRGGSALALDRSHVFVIAGDTVVKVAKDGGPAVVVAKGLPAARAISVDDTRVYIANAGPRGTVLWIAK